MVVVVGDINLAAIIAVIAVAVTNTARAVHKCMTIY